MEPETHRLDREALRADRVAAAERVRHEIDAVCAASAAKRRAFVDRLIAELRADLVLRPERERLVASLLEAGRLRDAVVVREPAAVPAEPSTSVDTELLQLARAATG